MKHTQDSPGSLTLKRIFSIIAYMVFLLLDNYGKFDLTDDALFKFITLSSAGIKSTLEISAILLNLRKEFQVSFQLFVVL